MNYLPPEATAVRIACRNVRRVPCSSGNVHHPNDPLTAYAQAEWHQPVALSTTTKPVRLNGINRLSSLQPQNQADGRRPLLQGHGGQCRLQPFWVYN